MAGTDDGGIGTVMGKVRAALSDGGVPSFSVKTVMDMMWGEVFGAKSYAESLNIVMHWVNVE